MKQNNKTRILFRYGLIIALFLLVSLVISAKLFSTTVIDARKWNARAKQELSKLDTIAPMRGNILADNGAILACNVTVYDVKIDFRHKKLTSLAPVPWDSINALADSLDKYYPRHSDLHSSATIYNEYSWRTRFKEQFDRPADKRSRALRIAKDVTMEDFRRIRNFPLFASMPGRGFRIPVYCESKEKRIYPFGKMASLSIGRVYEVQAQDKHKKGEIHGYSGLEKDLDSLLYGKPGYAKKVAMTNGIGSWTTTPAVDGYNLITTINIDMQDMLETELVNICRESKAEWGTAILMEVATGEIKAISNVEVISDESGTSIKEDASYGEALNRAMLAYEPGSVMKPISLMIAFEDGLVHSVNDRVDCSPFQRTKDEHAPGVKTMKQVIEMSSNTGISRVIFRGYASDPSKFHDRLASIGFFDRLNTGIAAETTPRVRKLLPTDKKGNNITMTARHLDLARQAYGYNTEIPPIYTLAFYNAIANGGKFVRPHIVRGYRFENGRDSILPITYVRERICSEENARRVRECIHEVVWGDHGTARAVRDDRVKVAGKTGTAFPVSKSGGYDKSKRRFAFCGFFPYDNPKYSCIALVLAPGGKSANRTSGQVVKNMALKMYAHGMLTENPRIDGVKKSSKPVFAASNHIDRQTLCKDLDIDRASGTKKGSASPGRVPDLRGYDVASAVGMLEKLGLNVRVIGSGHVKTQSIPHGTPLRKGATITLTLGT